MNVPQNNQSYSFTNPQVFNRIPETEINNSAAEAQAVTGFVFITRLLQKEMENMKTSFRNQVRNVVALDQFIRKRLVQAGSGKGGAEPVLIGINFGEELSFRLPGSDEAFNIFIATLKRKSYFLHHRSRAEPEAKILKVNLKVADITALEQELSIILENITPADHVTTVLQRQHRQARKQKLAG
jgi:hypothetical protein